MVESHLDGYPPLLHLAVERPQLCQRRDFEGRVRPRRVGEEDDLMVLFIGVAAQEQGGSKRRIS